MLAYLVQHGKAKTKDEDPDRPLTDEGRKEVEAVMLLAQRFGAITASRVVHSGKRRAAETAELIASKLEADVEAAPGLDPDDDPAIWAGRLGEADRDLVVVGHLPHLERLTSFLLCGNPDAGVVRFANGGVVCLSGDGGGWTLQWAITPALVQE
ncbi:MAG TPA: phosphohistidine phosphatase SixA [Longimicrobiales bacterium]|nr:phosphohistidine phosphatase SixA [Longimicrobiales bacterium]